MGAGLLLLPGLAMAEYALNFQAPVTEIARDVFELHTLILKIVIVIFIVVFAVMFYSIFAHRKSRGHKAANFHESTTVEVFWTIIPFIILVAMAIPSTATLLKMDDTSGSDMTVKIVGYQWKWQYEYLDHDISFFSTLSTPRAQIENKEEKGENYLLEVDNPIVLPVGKKIRFVLTANDVIHSWWVPQLAIKKDAIPGFINEMWTRIDEPGIYRGQCAELCGKDHGFMPIVVKAVSQEDFNKWVSLQKDKAVSAAADSNKVWTKTALMKQGKKVYEKSCQACHGATGAGIPGAFPAITGSKIATGPVKDHLAIVMDGKSGTAMQAFKGQLSDADLAAVVTFERNGLGNKAGDIVQPSQVKALR
ncbi:MAG: cytochrome c oxidase subunit II [Acidiferrobacterales bacterium]